MTQVIRIRKLKSYVHRTSPNSINTVKVEPGGRALCTTFYIMFLKHLIIASSLEFSYRKLSASTVLVRNRLDEISFCCKSCLLASQSLPFFFRVSCDYSQGILAMGPMRKLIFLHREKYGKGHKMTPEFSATFSFPSLRRV